MFVQQDCSLERLEQIGELVQFDMRKLVRSSPRRVDCANAAMQGTGS